jgi:hypothetical protein
MTNSRLITLNVLALIVLISYVNCEEVVHDENRIKS